MINKQPLHVRDRRMPILYDEMSGRPISMSYISLNCHPACTAMSIWPAVRTLVSSEVRVLVATAAKRQKISK